LDPINEIHSSLKVKLNSLKNFFLFKIHFLDKYLKLLLLSLHHFKSEILSNPIIPHIFLILFYHLLINPIKITHHLTIIKIPSIINSIILIFHSPTLHLINNSFALSNYQNREIQKDLHWEKSKYIKELTLIFEFQET
jgi:hypothetical protein